VVSAIATSSYHATGAAVNVGAFDLTVDTNVLKVDSANNRVGVNITSPTVALDVVGAAKISGNLTVDTNTLFVDGTNNKVGIGTTTPTQAIQVYVAAADSLIAISRGDNTKICGFSLSPNGAYSASNVIWGFGMQGNSNNFNIWTYNGSVETSIMSTKNTGEVGFGTTAPTAKLDVNSDIIRLRTAKTPASATAAGNAGDICWDANFVYVCVATNTWKRSAIAAW